MVAGCQHRPPPPCNVAPALFCEPFETLASGLSAGDRKLLSGMSLEDIGKLHFDFGMYVRNRLGLWQSNELTRYFRSNGVDHADDMSTPLVQGLALYLRGAPVVLKELIAQHQPPPIMEPEPEATR